MRALLRTGCCLLALLASATPLRAQGVLERLRQATHRQHRFPSPPAPGQSAPAPSAASAGTSSEPVDLTDLGEELVGAAVLAGVVVSSPFWAPHYFLNDNLSNRGYFPGGPYALDYSDYLGIDFDGIDTHSEQKADRGDFNYLKPWALRVATEDGNDFRGLNRLDSSAFFDTTSRFGVQSHWDYFREDLGHGSDEAILGDTELTYRFTQTDSVEMYAGLGFRLLTDRTDTRGGVNFVYGADFYPSKPMVMSASADVGNLGAAFVVHGRCSVGAVYRHCEILGGYDFLRVGTVNLQGPFLGVRFWF